MFWIINFKYESMLPTKEYGIFTIKLPLTYSCEITSLSHDYGSSLLHHYQFHMIVCYVFFQQKIEIAQLVLTGNNNIFVLQVQNSERSLRSPWCAIAFTCACS